MTHVCPNCGHNQASLNGLHVGPLAIDRGAITWHGKRPRLTSTESLIVQAIAGCEGFPIKLAGICDAIDSEATDPQGNIAVLVCRIRKAFRKVDPEFDALETVRGKGFRWRIEAPAAGGSSRGFESYGVGSLNRTPLAQAHNLNHGVSTLELAGRFQ